MQITFNHDKLKAAIEAYKKDFSKNIGNEIYKWKAVKSFQNNWNIEAGNFSEMVYKSTKDSENLLGSMNRFPRNMIRDFAAKEPETVRSMFRNLYDESLDLSDRIGSFVSVSDELLKKYFPGKMHYQDYNAISTYLWLKYPNRYYIFKYKEIRRVTTILEANFAVKRGFDIRSLLHTFALYDEIAEILKADPSIRSMLNEVLTTDCDKDENLHCAVVDLGYFISKRYSSDQSQPSQDNEDASKTQGKATKAYSDAEFLDEVFMTKEKLAELKTLVKTKKNVILQGAPGVGKTFCAKRLAYTLMGEKNESRISFVQFHQNYSYEDFVMGYKPTEDGGFELKNGIFYKACIQAQNDPDRDYFFIIDEINRGNLSKIFGELLMLIENSYRDKSLTLAYKDELFCVPSNVYIIGMMNTADRSLAMIDYALRRRFSFFEMTPGFDSDGFKAYMSKWKNPHFEKLIGAVKELNKAIASDDSLGTGFEIGHSYFCGCEECTDSWLKSIVNYDIIPMLQEYWFDNKNEVQKWGAKLLAAIND